MQQPAKTNDSTLSGKLNLQEATQVGTLSLKQLAAVLVKHYGLHEGLYEASIDIQTSLGNIGMTAATVCPGAMFGVSGVGLRKAKVAALHTVDARVVNPRAGAAAPAKPQVRVTATTSMPAKFSPAKPAAKAVQGKATQAKPAKKSKK
jgi:hypothetical protein